MFCNCFALISFNRSALRFTDFFSSIKLQRISQYSRLPFQYNHFKKLVALQKTLLFFLLQVKTMRCHNLLKLVLFSFSFLSFGANCVANSFYYICYFGEFFPQVVLISFVLAHYDIQKHI